MATTLNMTLLLRRAEFAESCVLLQGEPGYHTTTKEFKIGDGTTTWKDLPIANRAQIEAIVNAAIAAHAAGYYTKEEINAIKKALEDKDAELLGKINENAGAITAEAQAREAADTQIRTDFAAADATTLQSAQSYADIKKAEVIGDADSTKDSDTIKGAKAFATDAATTAKSEAISAAAEDATSKANAAEAAAKSHAETKATAAETAAKNYADTQDTALHTTITGEINSVKGTLESAISSGDSATLQSAKDYTDEKVAAEALARGNADAALDERLEKLEAFFEGADHDGENGGLKDALDTLVEIQTYIETEGAAADEMVKDIAQNANDIDALEGRMGAAESTITSLGTNKLDKSTYENYIAGKELSDAALKEYADGKANTAQANAEAKAAELDSALKTELQAEIDSDVEAAIAAEVTRSDAKAKELADAAQAAAIASAEAKDATRYTTITGDIAKAKSEAIEAAASDATSKANTAETNAKSYADTKKAEAIEAAAGDATTKANAAEKNAKDHADAEIAKEKDRAEGQEAAIRGEFAAADVTTLTSAKNYADTAIADSHKDAEGKTFVTGTLKDAAHNTKTDPSFLTGITVERGHVTGATVQNLAEVLAGMTFIFDGGTSKE